MAKFHDEFFKQKDPEHDALVADVLENIEAVVELVYPIRFDAERQIQNLETERMITGKNGFIIGYVDVIAHVYDYSKDTRHEYPYLIIDAKPKLNDFGAVTRQIKTYQNLLYQQTHRQAGYGGSDYQEVSREYLDKYSQKVIITHSEPTRAALVLAKNENIFLIVHDKETGRFLRADDMTHRCSLCCHQSGEMATGDDYYCTRLKQSTHEMIGCPFWGAL
jgi:hypothetical protein